MSFILICRWLPKDILGMALFPFILVRDKRFCTDDVLIRHEKIHLRQQLELLIIIFYIWYVLEFFVRWVKYRSRVKAYRTISFEQEAYTHERNPQYLDERDFFAFLKYL